MPPANANPHFFPSRVEIDLGALASNVRRIKALAGDGRKLMAVIKADAYGHGAVEVARAALANGADMLAVANLAEAAQLRENGVRAPILTLSHVPAAQLDEALRLDLSLTVYDKSLAGQYLAALAKGRGRLRVHLKLDTGMHRLGVMPGEALEVARRLDAVPTISLEGVYTHFAAADEDADYTSAQLAAFRRALDALRAAGIAPPYVHAANSPALLTRRETCFNVVRPGVLLYGLSPMEDSPRPPGFRPVMRWSTRVAQVKTLSPGSRVGYGHGYTTLGEETLAVLPVGYADGLRRKPQTWRAVLLHGQRAPLAGRVSMEKIIVDVSEIPGVQIGDEAVLLGAQGRDEISAEEIGGWLGSNNYEVACTIAPRVPRSYRRVSR